MFGNKFLDLKKREILKRVWKAIEMGRGYGVTRKGCEVRYSYKCNGHKRREGNHFTEFYLFQLTTYHKFTSKCTVSILVSNPGCEIHLEKIF